MVLWNLVNFANPSSIRRNHGLALGNREEVIQKWNTASWERQIFRSAQLDYSQILERCQEDLRGNCVYCNHCLPCPVGINIGQVIRRLDSILRRSAKDGSSWDASYYSPERIQLGRNKDFTSAPSNCTECEVCVKRCPFEVDIISKMRQAASVLEGKQ